MATPTEFPCRWMTRDGLVHASDFNPYRAPESREARVACDVYWLTRGKHVPSDTDVTCLHCLASPMLT